MDGVHLIAARSLQSQVECVCNILRPHVGAELPRDDISAVIVQNCAEIEPTPTDNLQVSEVRLPKLIDGRGLIFELIGGLNYDEVWAGDQIMRFQHPVG